LCKELCSGAFALNFVSLGDFPSYPGQLTFDVYFLLSIFGVREFWALVLGRFFFFFSPVSPFFLFFSVASLGGPEECFCG